MAPKKKETASKAPAVVDASSSKETSENQAKLVEHLQKELDRKQEEHNDLELEYVSSRDFKGIAGWQLAKKAAELWEQTREVDQKEEQHQMEMKAYKEKVKHLLSEHQQHLTELKVESTLSLKRAQEDHWAQEMQLWGDVQSLQAKLREQELAYEALLKNMRLKQEEEILQLRRDYERQLKEMEDKHTEKMQGLQERLELQKKVEISHLEQRKNSHIKELVRTQEKALDDMKNYYEDINQKNMERLKAEDKLKEMEKTAKCLAKEKAKLLRENKRLKETLDQSHEEESKLQKKLADYGWDKEALKNAKVHLKTTQKELKDLQWEQEVLVQRFGKVQAERDELYQKFTQAIIEVQQKTGFKNLLLERKLKGLHSILERKEMELSEALADSNLDPSAFSLASLNLENHLLSKDKTIKVLQFKLARVCKAHNDMLKAFEGRLTAFGIPVDNLGFQPLKSPEVGRGPAGLISVPNWRQPTRRGPRRQAKSWTLPPLVLVPSNIPQ